MDLKQIEMDLSLKLEIGQAADYLEFVQCVTEIKYRSKFEMVDAKVGFACPIAELNDEKKTNPDLFISHSFKS
ncbi:hypothetical protein BpHYR1_033017 [Brachionus plicatilis]|uniref:Uncharacterized protein n=1 Tax=Brachionus plicatilis TaxID=10195 RepID=A0A3M7S597_BRAPC|nr:hypothetical protein BpHYR1_033017 [Brachionus plicatilis]